MKRTHRIWLGSVLLVLWSLFFWLGIAGFLTATFYPYLVTS